MGFLNVFIVSLLLTTIVGAFMSLTWRVARAPRALATYWGIALVVHLGWLSVPHLGALAPPARWLAIMWLGSMLAALMLIIPFALLSVFFRGRNPQSMPAYLPAAYVSCFLLAGAIVSVTSTADFVVREDTIRVAGLPADLDGFRIANIGDVHIGRFIDAKELSRGIEALNRKKVDLLVVTGDLIDDVTQLESAMRALELSAAPYKTVAILGNHEVANLSEILRIYAEHKARITLLVNQNIAISRGSAALHIVGVDFPMNPNGGHMLPRADQDAAMSAQADAAFSGLVAGETVLALSHHPAFFPFAAAHGAQLTLASHTHGGQIQVFGRPLVDAYPYLQGLYRRGDSYLDVSAGFGHWLPIRFGVPREIVIVTLRGDS
jgi:uncharacterized protein